MDNLNNPDPNVTYPISGVTRTIYVFIGATNTGKHAFFSFSIINEAFQART